MKNPITKSMLRSPLKTILKIGIISLALYFFISSAVKLLVVNTETERIGSYYTSIGKLEPIKEPMTREDYLLKPEVRKLISESEYIDFENSEWRSQGINPDLLNIDSFQQDFYPNDLSDFMFVPESDINIGDFIFIGRIESMSGITNNFDGSEGVEVQVKIEKSLSGYPEYGVEGEVKSIKAIKTTPIVNRPLSYITPEVIEDINGFKTGSLYLFRGYTHDSGYDKGAHAASFKSIYMKPLYEGGPLYYPIENINEFSLDNDQWAKLRENIEIIEENRHTFRVIPLKDMSKLPDMQEISRAYFLTEGRWIDIDDYNSENKVCVIYMDLAKARNLKVGDKISLKHRYLGPFDKYIFSEEIVKTWKDFKTSDPMEYEIVGIFNHLNEEMRGPENSVYVPESTIPMELIPAELIMEYSWYNFVLKTSKDEGKFVEEYSKKINDLGYNLTFVDSSARGFWDNAKAIKSASINNTLIFGILLIIAMLFTIYLHFQDFKRVYAIERTLGIPKKTSREHFTRPILIIMVVVTTIITIYSRFDSIKQVEKQLAEIGTKIDAVKAITISPIILILLFLGIMLVFTALLYFFVRRLEKMSIIELVQMGEVQKRKKSGIEVKDDDTETEIDLKEINQESVIPDVDFKYNTSLKGRVLNKFTGKQIIRSKLQTSLLILLALMFTFSILWLNQLIVMNKERIDIAYKNMEIDADFYRVSDTITAYGFTGDISEKILDEINSTNLVKETDKYGTSGYSKLYIRKNGEEKLLNDEDKSNVKAKYNVYYSNQLLDSDGKLKLEEFSLNDGVDPKIFNTKWHNVGQEGDIHLLENENGETIIPILASNSALEEYGLNIGDEISFNIESRKIKRIYGSIVGKFEKLAPIVNKNITSSTFRGPTLIMPLDVMSYMERDMLYYENAHIVFDREKNKELYIQSSNLKDLVAKHKDNKSGLGLKIWDEELRKVVVPLEKNLSLLEIVYPITLIISLLTAGFIAYVINLRKAKDMAILRVLGVSNREVKAISIKESLLLAFIGVIAGLILMIVLRKSEYEVGTIGYILAAGSFIIGTVLGLIIALKSRDSKKPLELLQVKE